MTINKCYTVKRLKEELENYDDDMPVLLNTRGEYGGCNGIDSLVPNKEMGQDEVRHLCGSCSTDDYEALWRESILIIKTNNYPQNQVLDSFWERQEVNERKKNELIKKLKQEEEERVKEIEKKKRIWEQLRRTW